jgi:hypothetical protein
MRRQDVEMEMEEIIKQAAEVTFLYKTSNSYNYIKLTGVTLLIPTLTNSDSPLMISDSEANRPTSSP